MTRSQIVSADTVKLAEFEDQLRELQNNFCRNFEELKGQKDDMRTCIREDLIANTASLKNSVLDELKTLLIHLVGNKGKGITEAEGETSSAESRGILPMPRDHGSNSQPVGAATTANLEFKVITSLK